MMRSLLARMLLAAALPAASLAAQEPPAPALLEGNMAINPSFEDDWMNNHAEGHVLMFRSDYSFNASDLKPDYWQPQGEWSWSHEAAHSGARSLNLGGGASLERKFPMGVWQSGGGSWQGPTTHRMEHPHPARAARTARAALWYRGQGLGGENTLVLTLTSFGVTREAVADADADQWRRLEVAVPREAIEQAFAAGEAAELPADATLSIRVTGQASVWIDDVSFAEDLEGEANLAINGSFEDIDPQTLYPREWGSPGKYRWRPPFYYQFTDWHHFFRDVRGPVHTTDLIARSGTRSLQMNVYPGDEVCVPGAVVVLNQTERGIVEIGVFVLADRIKWLDLRAVDEEGNDVPAVHAYQGRWRVPQDADQHFPSNAGTWTYVRKWFQGERPLKLIRPQLCARGFNGNALDDGGTRPNAVQVGTVWWDDLRVIERTATADDLRQRGVKFAEPVTSRPQHVMIEALDLGERHWGDNEAAVTLHNPTDRPQRAAVSLRRLSSAAQAEPLRPEEPGAAVSLAPGERRTVRLTYTISELAGQWDRQSFLAIAVGERRLLVAYNTWPVIADVDFSKHYATPEENPQTVSINLGVARGTLARTASLRVEMRRRRDQSVTDTLTVADLHQAFADMRANLPASEKESFEFDAPAPGWWNDKKNLLLLKFDLSKLPVHPADKPVRDHFLRVVGLDEAGKELFADSSQRFGRVEQIREELPRIEHTSVRHDGAVLVNGEPVYMLAKGLYPSARVTLTPELIKRYGFNAVRWVEGPDKMGELWSQHGLWSLEGMVRLHEMEEAKLRGWLAEGKFDGAVTLAPFYEHSTFYDGPEVLQQQRDYIQLVRQVARRVPNFGGGGAHGYYTLQAVLPLYESFGLELEPVGPPRGGYELAEALQRGDVAWFHLPQTYDNEPFDSFRYDQYETILQGGRGYSIIQGIGDPSFYRGINGELRYLSPAIFSLDHGDEGTSVSPAIKWMQRRVNDERGERTTIIAVNSPPIEIGAWTWRETDVFRGRRAHTGVSDMRPLPTPDGLRLHGYKQDRPIVLQPGDKLVQYVWLDPANPPATIAWGPRGDARWDFNGRWGAPFDHDKWKREWIGLWLAGELTSGTGEITRWHTYLWNQPDGYAKQKAEKPDEAEQRRQRLEELREWSAQAMLGPDSFKLTGALPPAGQWTRLELDAQDAGLVGVQIDGFLYLAKDGEAWWDHTALLRDGREIVLCGDSVGVPPDELAAVRFAVPWAPDGTRVEVLFEDRELTVQDGQFVDDFRGWDWYVAIRDAMGGGGGYDAEGRRIHARGVSYSTPNAPPAVHVYEVVLPAR